MPYYIIFEKTHPEDGHRTGVYRYKVSSTIFEATEELIMNNKDVELEEGD